MESVFIILLCFLGIISLIYTIFSIFKYGDTYGETNCDGWKFSAWGWGLLVILSIITIVILW